MIDPGATTRWPNFTRASLRSARPGLEADPSDPVVGQVLGGDHERDLVGADVGHASVDHRRPA
jgi:hypothetical protein